MEPDRKNLSNQDIETELTKLKRNGVTDNAILELVRSDYQHGLLPEEIAIYLEKNFDLSQRQFLSKVIRDQGAEVADAIAIEGANYFAMQVAIEYYEKGVPLERIAEYLKGNTSAYALKQIYVRVLNEIKEADEKVADVKEGLDKEYLEKVISEMKEIVININHNSERYDAMADKLDEIEVSKKAEHELETVKEQLQQVKAELEYTKKRLQKVQDSNIELSKELEEKEEALRNMEKRAQLPISYTPYHPQVAQTRVVYEPAKEKSQKAGLFRLLGRQEEKPERQDITRMVVSGQLKKEQLVQIKVAMERGLTDAQVSDLIQGNVSAEQMKEIIEIAVLENSIR